MKQDERAMIEMIANEGKHADHEQWIDDNGTIIDFLYRYRKRNE